MADPVNKPSHYQIADGIEAIDVIRNALTDEQYEGYLLGNFLKYRLRLGDKDAPEQDLAKSNRYRDMLRDSRRGVRDSAIAVNTTLDHPAIQRCRP